ncbi:MAG: tetratricopeptide repeat protein [Alphaproteobacteria bacterium]|nr:tetratricopeptide repeat protein [Alphaproteobacteria bacterium]
MPKKSTKKIVKRAAAKPAKSAKPVAMPIAKPIARPIAIHSVNEKAAKRAKLSLYIYWVIIIFFVASTFYILGRGHHVLFERGTQEISMSARGTELLTSGKDKLMAGDVPGAIEDMTAAIESDPKSALAYTYRGEAYMSEANYAAAAADLDFAISLDPKSSLALYDRALLNIRLGNLEMALSDLNSALNAFGKRPNEILTARDIYSRRAQLNLWMKNWDAAIADYSASLNNSPNNPSDEDFAGRAEAFTALGKYQEALNDYMTGVTTISETIKMVEDPMVRINMSRRAMSYFEKSAALHVQIGDMAAARTDLEAANTLANALNDEDARGRIQTLLINMQ